METQANPFKDLPRLAFIIGAQKAGTTFLASILAQHPEICVSQPKETQFLSLKYDKGFDFYASRFLDKSASVWLDASTTYSLLRSREERDDDSAHGVAAPVPERIKALNPDARLIYILRNPAERAASAYRHFLRSRPAPDGPVSLMECIRERPVIEIGSRYSEQIERYREHFSDENLLFLNFRDLKSEPAETARHCFEFLGLPGHEIDADPSSRSRNTAYTSTAMGRIALKLRRKIPRTMWLVRSNLPGFAERFLLKATRQNESKIEFHDMEDVRAYFADEVRRIEEMTGHKI